MCVARARVTWMQLRLCVRMHHSTFIIGIKVAIFLIVFIRFVEKCVFVVIENCFSRRKHVCNGQAKTGGDTPLIMNGHEELAVKNIIQGPTQHSAVMTRDAEKAS